MGICSGYSSTEIWIELEFGNVGFCGEGKTGVPGEKPLIAEKRTNNKLNPHIASSSRIYPEPHRWEASALTSASFLLPIVMFLGNKGVTTPNFLVYTVLGLSHAQIGLLSGVTKSLSHAQMVSFRG